MALTITKSNVCHLPNGSKQIWYSVAWDSSYASGGEVFDVSADFAGSPDVLPANANVTTTQYFFRHDNGTAAAGKLVAYTSADGAEASGDLSGITAHKVLVTGTPK